MSEQAQNTDSFVIVFTGTQVEAEMTNTFLNAEGIQAFVKDGALGTIAPWLGAAGGAGAVKVLVRTENVEEARALLESTRDSGETAPSSG